MRDRAVVTTARWILISKAKHDTNPLDLRISTLDVVLELGELDLLVVGEIALLVARFVVHVMQRIERFSSVTARGDGLTLSVKVVTPKAKLGKGFQMAQVQVEEIVDHLSSEFRKALKRTIDRHFPDEDYNAHQVFRDFRREVRRACSTWEYVPDHCVDSD